MKLLLKFFFLIVLLGVFSCQENKTVSTENQPIHSSKIEVAKKDTINPYDEEMKMTIREAREKIEDLIRNSENQEIYNNRYERKSKITDSDLYIKIQFGNIFTETDMHAVISVDAIYQTLICVYYYNKTESDSLQTVLYLDEYGSESYSGDTIRDVNGDNKKDLIIDLYQMSGCCLVQPFDIYLFQTETKFTEKYEFVNPTFYPKEQVIRGITYGQNGRDGIKYDKGLYKYKWNGLKVDTVEFIYYNREDSTRRTYFKTKKWESQFEMENVEKIKLNSIPKEYHSIDGLDNFKYKDD